MEEELQPAKYTLYREKLGGVAVRREEHDCMPAEIVLRHYAVPDGINGKNEGLTVFYREIPGILPNGEEGFERSEELRLKNEDCNDLTRDSLVYAHAIKDFERHTDETDSLEDLAVKELIREARKWQER